MRPGRTVALILTLNGSNNVFPPKDGPFGGQDDGWRHMGKIFPKNSPNKAWIGSFKPKRLNLYIAISPKLLIWRTSDLRSQFRPRKALHGWSAITQSKYNMADGRHLENRNEVIFVRWVFRFGRNSAAACKMKWSRSKPEVEFQYGGRLYFETRSSYISAANWDISTKFGSLIDFDLLKAVTSTNTKPEVVFSGRGRHLNVIFPQWVLRFGRNSVAWCRITCRFRPNGRNRNRK